MDAVADGDWNLGENWWQGRNSAVVGSDWAEEGTVMEGEGGGLAEHEVGVAVELR